MHETTCVNTLLLYGLIAMASVGFIQAAVTLWMSARREKDSPFS